MLLPVLVWTCVGFTVSGSVAGSLGTSYRSWVFVPGFRPGVRGLPLTCGEEDGLRCDSGLRGSAGAIFEAVGGWLGYSVGRINVRYQRREELVGDQTKK